MISMRLLTPTLLLPYITASWLPAFVHDAANSVGEQAKATFENRENVLQAIKEFNEIDPDSQERDLLSYMRTRFHQKTGIPNRPLPSRQEIEQGVQELAQRQGDQIMREVAQQVTGIAGINAEKLAVKLLKFYGKDIKRKQVEILTSYQEMWQDPALVDEVVKGLMKEFLPNVMLRVLRESFKVVDVDENGSIGYADVETRIMASYLMFFCPHEEVYFDNTKLRALRGNVTKETLSGEDVRTWAETLDSENVYCSNFFAQASSYNWAVVQLKAKELVFEIDRNNDKKVSYTELTGFRNRRMHPTTGNNAPQPVQENNQYTDPAPWVLPTDCVEKAEKGIRIIMVLDKSASMMESKYSTIAAYNQFLNSQKSANVSIETHPPQFTMVQFDSKMQQPISYDRLCAVEPLRSNTFNPAGSTALYDTVGEVINQFTDERDTILIIITDGYDTFSKKFTPTTISELIQRVESELNWSVTYVGANQDVRQVSSGMGVQSSLSYAQNDRGISEMFDTVGRKVQQGRHAKFFSRMFEGENDSNRSPGDPQRTRQMQAVQRVMNVCTCENGLPANGLNCAVNNTEVCIGCNMGYTLENKACTRNMQNIIEKRLQEAGAGFSQKIGSLAISLMWDHSLPEKRNDLDLWITTPSGERIGFSHKRGKFGGELDVDRLQNAKEPVENTVWLENAPKGTYKVQVHNYSLNHRGDQEFQVSIVKNGGKREWFEHVMPGKNKKWIDIATFEFTYDDNHDA